MESNLVCEFVAHTGAEPGVARTILQAEGWDLPLAIKAYYFLMGPLSGPLRGPPSPPNSPCRPLMVNGVSSLTPPQVPPPPPQRPTLHKADAIDLTEGKKLARGISRATDNVNLVSKARSEFALDFRDNTLCNLNQYFIETPIYTFTLPDLSIYPEDLRSFLERDLIETSTLVSLEQAGRLNWWADLGVCQRLWPLATSGDGNCLLHAASLGMWGFHDRLLTLRKALHAFLTSSDGQKALWRRWRWQQTQLNAQAGLVYSDLEWRREWDSIVNMASTAPRKNPARRRSAALDPLGKHNEECQETATYESLEEVHVLALAHVLRRPIIVIADVVLKDVHGEALAPIPFGGIYLPLECPPAECHRSPLVLTYDAAHFSALVVMEREVYADKTPQPPAAIPLTDSNHDLLPIQFSVDPGEQVAWGRDELSPSVAQRLTLAPRDRQGLLREYLDVVAVPLPGVEEATNGPQGEAWSPLDLGPESASPPPEDDELERRLSELELECEEGALSSCSDSGVYRSRAAKQLQSVAKQFGSIGKSMSKKLKKNLGSITKMTRTNSLKKKTVVGMGGIAPSNNSKVPALVGNSPPDHLLCAVLHTETRHEYQEAMVRNYLQSARARFERDRETRAKQAEDRQKKAEQRLEALAAAEGPSLCVNPGCNLYGTALTSYLCTGCYAKQRDQEQEISKHPGTINSPGMSRAFEDNVRYGAGRSRFYAESDSISREMVSRLPLSRAGSNMDQTLYLSKSTFYNDCPGTPQMNRLNERPLARSWQEEEQPRLLPRGEQNLSQAPVLAQGHVTVVSVNSPPPLEHPREERVHGSFKLPVAEAKPCRTFNCKFFGCAETNYYCSKCHKENQSMILGRSMNVQEMRI